MPLRTRFRGITVRAGMVLPGSLGWAGVGMAAQLALAGALPELELARGLGTATGWL